MTDAEIIRALECCTNTHLYTCDDCPFNKKCESDENVLRYALDLINRQNEYIKKCDNLERVAEKTIETQKAELERLNGLLGEWKKAGYKYADSFDSIKSEAVKEFTEKLKDKLQHRALFSVNDTIDEILKEMAGDTE